MPLVAQATVGAGSVTQFSYSNASLGIAIGTPTQVIVVVKPDEGPEVAERVLLSADKLGSYRLTPGLRRTSDMVPADVPREGVAFEPTIA